MPSFSKSCRNISLLSLAANNELLVAGLNAGNLDLYKALFLELYPALVRYSSSITGDREAARELAQDLFLDLWEIRPGISIKGSVKAYLFSAIYHKSLNWIRSSRIRSEYARNPVVMQNWFPGAIRQETSDFCQLEIIEREICNLPDRPREVFTRAVILGHKLSEIAVMLGLSEKTAANHLARARQILRSRLKKIR